MMRKSRFLMIVLLVGNSLFAQSKKIQLPWSNVEISAKINSVSKTRQSTKKSIPASLNLRWEENGPIYSERWPDQSSVRQRSVWPQNLVWGPVSQSDLQRLASVELPTQFKVDIGAPFVRSMVYRDLFNPFIRVNETAEDSFL